MSEGRSGQQRVAAVDRAVRHQAADLYETLEVSPRASQAVIRAAYRVLARSSHPDVNVGADAESRIRNLNAAYLVLSDPERRSRYDFERSRARRHEHMLNPVPRTTLMTPGRVRATSLSTRDTGAGARSPVMRGGALVLLVLVAVLTTLLLVLVLAILDPVRNDVAVHTQMGVHSSSSF